jgi:hypothetical protein
MPLITVKKKHNLIQLHDELVERFPSLRPKKHPTLGVLSVFTLAGDGETVTLEVPNGADVTRIKEAIRKHKPDRNYNPEG